MSRLTVYRETDPAAPILVSENAATIRDTLAPLGIRFERWAIPPGIGANDPAEAILEAFRPQLDALIGAGGAGTADVIKMTGRTDAYPAMRNKFLDEHTHTEDEVRFFVEGGGTFTLHMDGKVYAAYCTSGDLISVPAGIKHWFDAGEDPMFTVLRVFTDTTGWTPHYTGDPISTRFATA